MSVILDLLAGAVAGGAPARRRARRRGPRVRPSRQLAVGTAAVVVEALVLTAVGFVAGEWAFELAADDLLFVLGLLLLPVILTLLAAIVGAAVWLAGVARRLWARDGAARIDLAAAGVLGLLAATSAAIMGQLALTLALGTPGAACVVVALSTSAWQPAGGPDPEPPVRPVRWL